MNELRQLVGMFAFHDDGQSYRTGAVKAAIKDTILVQWDRMGKAPGDWSLPMELVPLVTLVTEGWGFFENRKKLTAFLAFAECSDDDKAKVVKMHRKPPVPGPTS
jgi:hypothetical protein